jgi:general secretion pathway protein G
VLKLHYEPRSARTDGRELPPGCVTALPWMILLTVVVTMIAVAIPEWTRTSTPSSQSVLNSQLSTIAQALDAYHTDTGRFPTAAEGLAVFVTPNGSPSTQPYLQSAPLDPWKRNLIYLPPTADQPHRCRVICVGPDGVEGTGDDINTDVSTPQRSAAQPQGD